MLDPISDLNEMSHLYGPVTMLAMDFRDIEKYFGRIHAATSLFRAHSHGSAKAVQLVQVSCQLLERAVEHHRSESRSATSNAVKIYDAIVFTLYQVLNINLRVTEQSYENAQKQSLSLNALMACGIHPPGYQSTPFTSRFSDINAKEARRASAFEYIRNNTEEFTRFVFDIAYHHKHIPDPLMSGEDSVALGLFQRVKSLKGGFAMIEGQSPQGNV